MNNEKVLGKFNFCPIQAQPAPSLLYDQHLSLTSKSRMADFAGYLMPLWYSSISAEHQAVRQTAGLFDCTHMGVLEVAGKDAEMFLYTVCTNDVTKLKDGAAQYSYILDAVGHVLDDIIIYKRSDHNYMVVVNAANEPKIKAYFEALEKAQLPIDLADPQRPLAAFPNIRDMRDANTADDCRVDIALQGPASKEILSSLIDSPEAKQAFDNLKPFKFIETEVSGIDCIISTTGYTGSKTGYELFAHPAKITELWQLLLDSGKSAGLIPCGLGARDSLRIEAGLPLYGHELDGPLNINPFQAGYPWAVKLDKEFFIGKDPIAKAAAQSDMHVTRLQLPGQKGLRPARQNDPVLDPKGLCIGWILSAATVDQKQIALALIKNDTQKENDPISVYYLARNQRQIDQGKVTAAELNQKLDTEITGQIITRFEKF